MSTRKLALALPLVVAYPHGPLQSPPRMTRVLMQERLTDAWVAESKDGLVQMLRDHRAFSDQALAVFAMLGANAPTMPDRAGWLRGRYMLASSHAVDEAIRDTSAGEHQLAPGLPVSVRIDGSGDENSEERRLLSENALTVEMLLQCGIGLRVTGTIRTRTVIGDTSGGLLTSTLSASELFLPSSSAASGLFVPSSRLSEALQECETVLRPHLPSTAAPMAHKFRPLFVDFTMAMLQEASRPRGRERHLVVLAKAPDAQSEAPAEAPAARRAGVEAQRAGRSRRGNRDEWVAAAPRAKDEAAGTVPSRGDAETRAGEAAMPPSIQGLMRRAQAAVARGPLALALGGAATPAAAAATPAAAAAIPAGVASLLGGMLLVGPYPAAPLAAGETPTLSSYDTLRRLLSAGGACFVSAEDGELLPAQTDRWSAATAAESDSRRGGAARRPVRYAPYVDARARRLSASAVSYLRCGMSDGSVPVDGLRDGASMLRLLEGMLEHYETAGLSAPPLQAPIYVHSDGDGGDGGRAALVASCMVSLLHPTWTCDKVMRQVTSAMLRSPPSTSSSSSTSSEGQSMSERQGRFLASFVSAVRAAERASLAPPSGFAEGVG